ncbi:NRDE family protein [Flavobacterium dankookense]|uniref:Transport and Golgi organization protein 2 n=1 Tax=Flavobacterium dankookense TaxID=706186 RepID=A0A4R6Q6X5_9FLAO|nr:NRDE family protein [Flavobacterium dankookense]TDP57790.1 transport and Golgi organization protein 2 [Flavobacterium dankookense]
MCTVSFVSSNGKTIITSNRDEKVLRPSAIEPKNYQINTKNVFFPKDPKAGGTWFAVDENSNVLVLLNGAEEKHILKEKYNRSRGLIVLELIGETSPLKMWQTIDLDNVEPFTLVLFEDQKLYQLRWNEIEKTTLALDVTKNHIWSSSTLYSAAIREKRANWFNTFLDTKPEVNEAELFNFHRYTEEENTEHGLVINRNDALKTLSITQAVVEKNKVQMTHYDLMKNDSFNHAFIII